MISTAPRSPGLEDLRPMSRGITIIPRSRSTSRASSRDSQWRTSLKCDSASSVQSVADESVPLVVIERMLLQKVKDKKDDLKAAFFAIDEECNGTVTKGEFRRVIEGFLLPLTQAQFEGLFAKVPKRGNGTVPYVEFLQQYCKVSTAPRSMSCNRTARESGGQRSWPLGELQCRLKDKIGGNLKNITRAFRLFDYNRDGQIQQYELRRVLESYCFPLTHQEFRRLWSHYSPNNSQTISYKEFLEKLGVDCENYRKIAPDCTKTALNWAEANQNKARPKSRTLAWETSSMTQYSVDEIQTMFLKKMSVNYPVIEKALQALDVTDSGIVSYDDLKSVLTSFLFPINHSSFFGLVNRFGLNPAEPVEWRKFIALFRKEEQMLPSVKDARPAARCPVLSGIEDFLPKMREQILEVFPYLKRAFLVFDENRTGLVSRGDLRRLLESLTFTLTDEQFRELTDLLHMPHSGFISYQHVLDFFQTEKPAVPVREQFSESTEKPETQTPPPAQTPPPPQSSATASWTVVEGVLKEHLAEHLASLMSSLSRADPTLSYTIPSEDLRKILQHYGLPLSDSHFNKLCEPFLKSGAVNYQSLLTSLGMCVRNSRTERNESPVEADGEKVKRQAVVDVVLKKLRDRLQMRGITLQQCLMDTCISSASVLDLRSFQKILDDCRISLQAPQLHALIHTLGFYKGPIPFTDFLAKYEGVLAKASNDNLQPISANIEGERFMSADDCLIRLEERIKERHKDVFTAFRLMDRNRDGLVNYNDFRVLFDSLRFMTKEKEYQRLLELLGFKPGATVNYAEFCRNIQSDKKNRTNFITSMTAEQLLERACEQVHAYLVATAHTPGSELSKALTQYGEDSESKITKDDLRQILYKYYLPISPREYEIIWARYDADGKGYVTQTDFLNQLNMIKPHEPTQFVVGKTIDRTTSQNLLTGTELQHLKERLMLRFKDVHQSLVELDKKGDGHVTALDMLVLLQTHGFQIEDRQLLGLINNLGLDVCKLSYHDFLERIAEPRLWSGSRSDMMPQVCPSTMSSLTGDDDDEILSPEIPLQKVKELVTSSLDTLTKAFTAFDQSKTGTIAQAEFRRVLDHFCIKLSDMQYKHLLDKLSIKEEQRKVDWRHFLRIFNLHNQETSEEWLEKLNKMRFPNQTRPLPISDILNRIQEVVTARIYSITEDMVDLDYAGVNMISKQHFRTICDRHFMRLTDEQFEALWTILPTNSSGNLHYREFLKRFSREPIDRGSTPDPPERLNVAAPQCPKTAPCSIGRNKSLGPTQLRLSSAGCEPSTVKTLTNSEATERRLRAQIRSCWQEIQRKCRKADTLSKGDIDIESFLGILKAFHISIPRSQFEQLSEKYNISCKERLSYPEFLQHFVLTLKPQVNTFRRKLHVPSVISSEPLSKQCMDTLLRLCPSIQLYWRTMKQEFISCDKKRTGKISLQDFRKVLRQYNIDLSEEDVFHLSSCFDKNISGRISYIEFLSILQK